MNHLKFFKTMDGSNAVNEITLRVIECPICVQHMNPPIYSCLTGHTLCEYCVKKLQNCPNCKVPLCWKSRNYYLENLSEQLKYPCPFETFGCTENVSFLEMKAHKRKCEFRKFKCAGFGCNFESSRKELVGHIKECHSSYASKNTVDIALDVVPIPSCNCVPGKNTDKWVTYLYDDEDRLFRVCCGENGMHVHTFNPEEEHRFELTFSRYDTDRKNVVTVTEKCIDIDEPCGKDESDHHIDLDSIMPPHKDTLHANYKVRILPNSTNLEEK